MFGQFILRKAIILILSFSVIKAFGQDDSGKSIERLNILSEVYNRHFVSYVSKMVDSHQAYWESDYKREASIDSATKHKREYRKSDSTYLMAKAIGVKQDVRSTYMKNLKEFSNLTKTVSLFDSGFRKEFDGEKLPESFYDEVHQEIKKIKVLDD